MGSHLCVQLLLEQREYGPQRTLAVGYDSFADQKFLQAQTALCDPFGVFYPHVAVVPRLPLVASIGLLTARVGEDKTVLVSMARQPLSSGCVTERHLHLVVCLRVREVNGGAELVLAVPGRALIRSESAPYAPFSLP